MTPSDEWMDPTLDLVVERRVHTTPQTAWSAWTRPEHLRRWYAPTPTEVAECQVDLRPGGRFRFVLRTEDGATHAHDCCYLAVAPFERLVWTDALVADYRPAPSGYFTAVMTLEDRGDHTICRTVAMHRNRHDRDEHDRLGFHDGWGTVLDQLAALAPTLDT